MRYITFLLPLQFLILCIQDPAEKIIHEEIEFGMVNKGLVDGWLKQSFLLSNQDSVPITYWADTIYDNYLMVKFTETVDLWNKFDSRFNFVFTTASDTENLEVDFDKKVYYIDKEADNETMSYFIIFPVYIKDTAQSFNNYNELNYKSKFIKIRYKFQYTHNFYEKTIYLSPGDSSYQIVHEDIDNLFVKYAPGDTSYSITKNIDLPITGLSGSKISWSCSDSSIISNSGQVNRPSNGKGIGDVDITVTASISSGRRVEKKSFNLTVVGNNPVSGTVTDVEGNVYQTVQIGNQEWTIENLRTIKFNDGSPITQITDNATWQKYNGTAFCYYQNTTNLDSIKKMGALYNWNVVNTGRLAPEGWHVPSDSDWNVLLNYLISQGFGKGYVYGSSSDSLVAKSIASRTGWKISKTSYLPGNNPHSSNITGFSARPSYARMQTGFFEKDDAAFWWSSTSYSSENALYRSVHWDLSTAIEANRKCNKNYGFSIRLIKDPTFSISTSAINGSIKKSPDKPFYKNGEKVTLEAIPNNGFRFQCWNGDVSGSTSLLSVTMQKNLNLSAVFSHGTIGYSLTVNSSKNGVIKIDPLRPDYDSGEVVTLTAVPSNGYVFTKWSGDAIGIETVAKLNMDRNMNVTAHFAALCTLEIVGSNGSVLKKPEKALYIQGDTVNITVTPNQGYTFAGWSGDAGGNSTSLNVVVNSSKRIKANCIADSTDSVVDIDGNVYHTIRIGNQIWTVENLRSTKYTDGTQIEQMSGDWTSLTRAAMRFQYMDSDSIKKFGALYNGFAVNTQKLAPAGWHIPSDEEWKTMIAYLVRNGYNYDWTNDTTKLNTLAKALSAKTCWGATVFPSEEPGDITNDMSTNNSSGFSALPAGYYTNGIFGTYQQGCWWTMITNGSFTTPYYYMQTFSSNLQRGYTEKTFGCSVRLVKN